MSTRLLLGRSGALSFLVLLAGAVGVFAGCDTSEGCDDCVGADPVLFNTIDSYPAWSPDGRTIAYTHWPQTAAESELGGSVTSPEQVWLLDVETLERRFLAAGWGPSWSPDEARIAFVRHGDIYVVEVKTGTVERLTRCGDCFYPAWSPDGALIAYDAVFRGDSSGVWTMRPDGTDKTQLLQSGRTPDWSPGGEMLAIEDALADSAPYDEIAVLDFTEGTTHRLTFNDRTDRSPTWSPDRSRIVWHSYGEGNDPTGGIWVMGADGSNPLQLTRGGGFPTWSPDGRHIAYYQTYDEQTGTLWVMEADGSGQRPLTHPSDYQP